MGRIMREFEVGSYNELVEGIDVAAAELKDNGYNLWWRGQVRQWPLVPSVHRREREGVAEEKLVSMFRHKARTRGAPVLEDETINWLMVMQHHGAPTRLLDWSESALVAAYFTCDDLSQKDETACLVALFPSVLNKYHLEHEGVPSCTHPVIRALANAAWKKKEGPIVAAFTPLEFDRRMMVQHTVFTIHRDVTPLGELANAGDYVAILKIMPSAKVEIRKRVLQFGMRRGLLFPDLDNLATELKELREAE